MHALVKVKESKRAGALVKSSMHDSNAAKIESISGKLVYQIAGLPGKRIYQELYCVKRGEYVNLSACCFFFFLSFSLFLFLRLDASAINLNTFRNGETRNGESEKQPRKREREREKEEKFRTKERRSSLFLR